MTGFIAGVMVFLMVLMIPIIFLICLGVLFSLAYFYSKRPPDDSAVEIIKQGLKGIFGSFYFAGFCAVCIFICAGAGYLAYGLWGGFGKQFYQNFKDEIIIERKLERIEMCEKSRLMAGSDLAQEEIERLIKKYCSP